MMKGEHFWPDNLYLKKVFSFDLDVLHEHAAVMHCMVMNRVL